MILEFDGERFAGDAIEAPAGVSAEAVFRAIHDAELDSVRIDCAPPSPVHQYVGWVHHGMSFPERAALAAAARTRGATTPLDDELARVEATLDACDPSQVDVAAAKKRVADAGEREAALQERVATLQGHVQARRDLGEPVESVQADLDDALQSYTAVQTERIAAEQALEDARARAREVRNRREERLRLEDRAGNLRRRIRATLAAKVRSRFEAALAAVPGDPDDVVTRALAVARVAEFQAPVVCASGRFTSAETAVAVIGSPVIVIDQG